MELARGNRAISEHECDGRELHLFEKTDRSGYYKHLGQFKYVSHEISQGQDVDGKPRSVILFKLELVHQNAAGSVGDHPQSELIEGDREF